MNKSYLIIDKPSRVELVNGIPYAVARIGEEIVKNGDSFSFIYNTDIAIKIINNKMQVLLKNIPIENYTHIIMRGHHTRTDYELKVIIAQYIADVNKVRSIDKQIKLQNSEFINILPHYSKIYQAFILSQNNIPFFNTYYKSDGQYSLDDPIISHEITSEKFILKHFTGENDLRIIDGKEKIKKNIYMIEKPEDFEQENLLDKDKADFFIQEFIPIGEDYRIYMKKDKFIGGWKRKATESFITVNKGEYTNYNNPTPEILAICIQTAKAFKSDFMAIDLMIKADKPNILEVNMNPGFKAYETKVPGEVGVDKANIAKEIVESF